MIAQRLRALFWFTPTPMGNDIPPTLSISAMLMIGAIPGMVLILGHLLDHWELVAVHTLLAAWATGHSVYARRQFVAGMSLGREELVLEMASAWDEGRMTPQEYLHREVLFGDDVAQAAGQVRRTARRSRRLSGSFF